MPDHPHPRNENPVPLLSGRNRGLTKSVARDGNVVGHIFLSTFTRVTSAPLHCNSHMDDWVMVAIHQ
jgi:hypothetical protein